MSTPTIPATSPFSNSLVAAPLGPLLDRLFAEADASWAATPSVAAYWAGLSAEERARLLRSKTDYRDFYGRLKDMPLAVSRETGRLLHMLARGLRARTVVEFGTSFGVSTLHLAAALRDNLRDGFRDGFGDGPARLITCEFEPSKAARARANLAACGLLDLVEIREGDALRTLASDLPETVDLLLLDGAKALYPEILDLVESRLRPGALIVADNADDSPEYLERVRSPARGYLSVPFASDVELSMRLGRS